MFWRVPSRSSPASHPRRPYNRHGGQQSGAVPRTGSPREKPLPGLVVVRPHRGRPPRLQVLPLCTRGRTAELSALRAAAERRTLARSLSTLDVSRWTPRLSHGPRALFPVVSAADVVRLQTADRTDRHRSFLWDQVVEGSSIDQLVKELTKWLGTRSSTEQDTNLVSVQGLCLGTRTLSWLRDFCSMDFVLAYQERGLASPRSFGC